MPTDHKRFTRKISRSPSPLWRAQLPYSRYAHLARLSGRPLSPALLAALGARGVEEYCFGALSDHATNPSRWSDGSFRVWYGAQAVATAVHEALHHAARIFVSRYGAKALDDWEEERTLVSAQCTALLVDVTGLSSRYGWLVEEDHSRCQELGRFIRECHQPGVLYDSARHTGGVCAAIFHRDALGSPKMAESVTFTLSGGTHIATDASGNEVASRPTP